jgi:site-specific recombinase XerD
LLPSWQLSLRAARKSPKRIRIYLEAGEQFLSFLRRESLPTDVADIRREQVELFIAELLDAKLASTAATRLRGLQQLFRWLEDEGEVTASPMAKMRPPKLDEPEIEVLNDEETRRLLHVCEGKTFDQRRDSAIIRVMLDTGMRRAECAGLSSADIDFTHDVAHVMGKGRRGRACPFGSKTAAALDRYLRMRRQHRPVEQPALSLGVRGRMTDSGVAQVFRLRGKQANITGLHPHVLRHTMAHAFRADDGSEGDLMRVRNSTARFGSFTTRPSPAKSGLIGALRCRRFGVASRFDGWASAHVEDREAEELRAGTARVAATGSG